MIARKLFWTAFALALFLGTSSCGGATDASTSWIVTAQTLNASDTPTTTFSQGDTVKIRITIKNNTATQQILSFPSVKNFEILIRGPNASTTIVWRWTMDETYMTGNLSVPFDGNEVKNQPFSWDGKNDSNVTVLAGTYTIEGIVTSGSSLDDYDSGNLFAPDLSIDITITP